MANIEHPDADYSAWREPHDHPDPNIGKWSGSTDHPDPNHHGGYRPTASELSPPPVVPKGLRMSRRDARRCKTIDDQLTYADGLIKRHHDAVVQLQIAKERLRKLQEVDAWSDELERELSAVTLAVRDCNWKQYG
jgi:hypothetical protein